LPLRFPAAAIRPPGRGSRPYQGGTLRCAMTAPLSRTPPMRCRLVILPAVPLSRRANLPCITSFRKWQRGSCRFSVSLPTTGLPRFLPKYFYFFRGFGTLPNKQKSPSFPVRDSGDFTERVPLSYACCVTFVSSEAPPGN